MSLQLRYVIPASSAMAAERAHVCPPHMSQLAYAPGPPDNSIFVRLGHPGPQNSALERPGIGAR
jgi:hypothetical protein